MVGVTNRTLEIDCVDIRGKGMSQIQEILMQAKKAGASDVHITVGLQPKMRVNGKLITMDFPKMLPPDTLEVIVDIMTEKQRTIFEERGE